MDTDQPIDASRGRIVAIQTLILLALCILAFLPIFGITARWAEWNPEVAHALAAPVLIAVLYLLRRRAIAAAVGPGSAWGLVLIVASIVVYFVTSWPFNYALPRRLALFPALAGVMLATGGWGLLKRTLPLIVILILAIPAGTRYYARVIIAPETDTLKAARAILELLPGVLVDRDGLDLSYVRGATEGFIAQGISNRGATLFMASLTVVVFVTFAVIRPRWQVVTMAILALPIVLVCNLLRLVLWGVLTIYSGATPLEHAPRYLSTVASLIAAWLISVGVLAVLRRLVEEPEEPAPSVEAAT